MTITHDGTNLVQADDDLDFPDISGLTGVSDLTVGSGTYQKRIYDIGDMTLIITGTLLHDSRKVVLVGNSNNMIQVRSGGNYVLDCDIDYVTATPSTPANVIGIYNTKPQDKWYGNSTLPQTDPTTGVVTVQSGGRWTWRGAGIVAPSGFHYGEGSLGSIQNAFFVSENEGDPVVGATDRHYISFMNSDNIPIRGLTFIGGEFINRSTNTTQNDIVRSQSAIAIFPNRVENFSVRDPVFDGTNTVDVPIQSEGFTVANGYTGDEFTRTKVINPSNGSEMIIVGGETPDDNRNFGYVEIINEAKVDVSSDENILEGKYYVRDTDNGQRKTHTEFAGIDDNVDKIYTGVVSSSGSSSTFSLVTCIVNVPTGYRGRGTDNTAPYTKDLRGKTNVLGDDIFDLNFIAYNHNYKLMNRSVKGNGTAMFSDIVEVDSNISSTDVAVVRDRLKNVSAQEVYERYKIHLVDNYAGETAPLVDLNDGVLDFGSADVHLIERAGGIGATLPTHEAGTFYVNSAEDPNVFDPSLRYGGKSGDTVNGNPWIGYLAISLDWRISFIKAGTYTETVGTLNLVYTFDNDTCVVHVGNSGETFDGGIRTDGEVFNTAGVIVDGGIFDSTGDSVLDFRNFGEWRLYLTEAQRDTAGSTPVAQGGATDLYKFNYSAGTTYWHWTRINKSSPWIPFHVTPELKGLTVVGITSDEILLSSLSALQSLPRHARLDTSLSVNGDGYVSAFNNLASLVTELEVVNVSDVTVLTKLDIDRDIPYKNIFVGGTRYTRIQLHRQAKPAKDATADDPAMPAVTEELYDTTSIMYKTCTLSGKQGGAGAWFSKDCIHNNTDDVDGIHVGVICDESIKPRNGCTLIILGLHNAHPDRVNHITIDGSNCTSGPSTILITDAVGEIDFINFTNPDVVCEVVGTQSLIHLFSTVTGIDMEYLGEHEIDNQSAGAEGDVLIDTHSVIDEFFNHKTSKSTLMGSVGLAIHELYSMIMEEASGTPNAHYAFKPNAIATAAETIWDAMLSAHVATGTFGNFVQNITSGGGTANLSTIEKTIYFNNLPQSDPNYVGDGSNRRPYQTWEEVTERLESDNIDKVVLQTDVTFPADIDPAFSLLIEGRDGKPIVNFNGQAYPRRYTYYNVDFRGITLNANEPFTTYDSASIGKGDSFTEAPTHLNGDHYRLTAGYIEPSAGCNLTLHDLRGKDGKLVLDLDLLTTEPTETPKIHIPNFLGHELRIKNLIPQGSVNIYIHAPDARVIIENNVSESLGTEGNTLIQVSSNYEVQNLTATATQKDLDDNDILDLDGNPIIIKKRVEVGAVGLSVGEKDEVRVKFLPKALQGDIVRDGFKVGIQTIEELTRLLTFHNVGTIELQSDYKMPSGFDYAISALWLGKTDILDTEIVTLDGNHTDMRSYEFEDMRLSGGFSGNAPFKTIGCRFKDFGIKIVSTTETDPVTLIETTTVTRTVEGGINGTHENVTFESEGNRFTDQCKVVCNEVYTTGGTLNLNGEGLTSGSDLTFNDVHASNIIIKNVASGLTLFVDCPNSNVTIDDSVDADANITLVCNGTITGDETKATVVRTTSESSVVSGDVDCSGFTIL